MSEARKSIFRDLKKLFADVTEEERHDIADAPSTKLSDRDKEFHTVHAKLALIRLGMTQRPVIDDRLRFKK